MVEFKKGDIIIAKETINYYIIEGKKYEVKRIYHDCRGSHPYIIQTNGELDWVDRLHFKIVKNKINNWKGELNE